jgi:LmbE family N-acetylglucosaminyl deacetylase
VPQTLFLAPHNDDETLFGAFTLLRERPHVVVCLRSIRQELRGTGVTHAERERETENALRVLGVESWEQWTFPDDDPPWVEIGERFVQLASGARRVYAPAYERRGHEHHNRIARLAGRAFPAETLTPYLTYTAGGRSHSRREVPYEPEWVHLKLRALACYRSQIVVPETWTTLHFVGDQREYYAEQRGRALRRILGR